MSEKCCNRVGVQPTHWEGCHEVHPSCAAFKAGREAGMREAAEVAKRSDITGWAMDGAIRDAFANAILAAIGEKHD